MKIDDSHMKPYVCVKCGETEDYYMCRNGKYISRFCTPCRKARMATYNRRKHPPMSSRLVVPSEMVREVVSLYVYGFTTTDIDVLYNITRGSTRRVLMREGVPRRTSLQTSELKSVGPPAKSSGGYLRCTINSTSPFFSMGCVIKGKPYRAVLEHRYVMAKHIGRPLEKWEVVHHKNHDRADNRIENLELISRHIEHHGETIAHTEFLKMRQTIRNLEAENEFWADYAS